MSNSKVDLKAERRIRRDGKLYGEGDTIAGVPSDQAKPLIDVGAASHAKAGKDTSGGSGDEPKQSKDLNAKDAIAHIEQAEVADLEGFLSEEEDRATVMEAWKSKMG